MLPTGNHLMPAGAKARVAIAPFYLHSLTDGSELSCLNMEHVVH